MKYKIICHNKQKNNELLENLYFLLSKDNESENGYDFLFLIGGDGTLISGLRDHFHQNIKIVHIKSGTNSFFGEMLHNKNLNQLLNTIQDQNYFFTYQVMWIEKNEQVFFAINDLYVQGSLFLESKIYVNNKYFQHFKGSSLLFSTQIGSTGLNKSVNSPIIFPELNAWIVTPIHAQVNKDYLSISNSLVVSEKEFFNIHLLSKNNMIFIDNQLIKCSNLESSEKYSLNIKIIRSKAQLFNVSSNNSYIDKLNSHFSKSNLSDQNLFNSIPNNLSNSDLNK